ncbi:MAG TPA: DUF3124 domain-containing protein [Novimethylophilus sp.]|uniref:DUF3124 domain-containing protein n=1 Tax=Novimethylophilus sp. TaxID=2137426 RepID=UPI002F41BEEA
MKTSLSRCILPVTLVAAAALYSVLAAAADNLPGDLPLSGGQTLYLPIYSHIWHGDRVIQGKYPLKSQVSALVSIRNTSLKTPIRVVSARYFSTAGKLLRQFIASPVTIGPMGTYELFVEKQEAEGGSGANFIIQWQADVATNPPVVEAVHADIKGHLTLTFVTTARPIDPGK